LVQNNKKKRGKNAETLKNEGDEEPNKRNYFGRREGSSGGRETVDSMGT